ncbi:uncharacterized protein B0J16DRAFT_412561 [Fusarium flagelliforme]|uniref:uncharacterized protein n=1 Tax=Fusarium flagelliforme TaxID=2675880 RepID=UPI001E8EA7FA|nr:uncharacterized protein B0J16DRAFT_412561 [Fusarium flagelliforme]KAH7188040.1 hypothetical protein B0J16DRAFT_412561 [Fusarium flagelliforme]
MVKKTRRSHTRSRNGCTRCVQVSRKCDEVHPSCGRCTRLSFACDYRPRLIWKPANFDSPSENEAAPIPAALNQRQPSVDSPCQCEQRPTSEELFQLFIDEGHNLLQWSSEQVSHDETAIWRSNPTLWAGIEALMSTFYDCCQVSSLSRVGHAITSTSRYIDLRPSVGDPESCQRMMVVLTQVSLRAGYAWTHLLTQMLSYAEDSLLKVQDLPQKQQTVQTQLLEVIGGLDMNVWVLCRRSPPLHIWARYCSGRQGVEEITGLPRPLLDLIAQVSLQRNVIAELEHYVDGLSRSSIKHQECVWHCYALAALHDQYRHVTPRRDAQPLLDRLAIILSELHQTLHKSNLRALIWPAYVLGRYCSRPGISCLVSDVLRKASTPDQLRRVLYYGLTPYDLMQTVWKLQATETEEDVDMILSQQFVDYGLW